MVVSNRVALVTGGIGGIGTAICRRLAEMGARVSASYKPDEESQALDWQREQQAADYEVGIVSGDVTDFDSCVDMLERATQRVGPVDILVNCAGITWDGTFRKMSPEQWHAVLNTNLDSIYNVTRQVIEPMLARGYGRIVNIASVNGRKGQFGQTNYATAKAGMHGFTMSLAQEVASKGITVNTVSPGYIGTSMVMAIPEEEREKILGQIPVGRLGEPEDVARMVAFLAADGSGFITGANFDVNGGLWMH